MAETNPKFDIALDSLNVDGKFDVIHKPGAIRLDGYPLLAYSPKQHGDFVCTEDHGVPVHEVANKAAELKDYRKVAAHFKTTEDHVRQAVAYAVEAGEKANT